MKTDAKTTENVIELQARIVELEALVKYYEEQLRLSKHRQFGTSSEKSEYDQLNIFNEAEITADTTTPEPEVVEIEKHYRKRTRLTTDKLPEELPVETVVHELPPEERICPDCGGELHVMGHETRRELKIIPAKVVVVEHVSSTYACRGCERNGVHSPILKPPMPEPVIKGSFASPEMVSYTMTQKFVMCCTRMKPRYRYFTNRGKRRKARVICGCTEQAEALPLSSMSISPIGKPSIPNGFSKAFRGICTPTGTRDTISCRRPS